MVQNPWHYLINTFLNVTRRSYKRANKIGLYTFNALLIVPATDAELTALKTFFGPIYNAYKAAYENWITAAAQEQGATTDLYALEAAINADITDWEYAVLGVYKKGTGGYKALFPQGISGLKRGTRPDRISKLNAFSTQLGATIALATTKADVDDRIVEWEAAAGNQESLQSNLTTKSTAVELSRVSMCIALYSVLGGLIRHFAETPDAIEAYFDIETLRSMPQTEFTNTVKATKSKFIAKRTLEGDDEVRIQNTGTVTLRFYFAPTKTSPLGEGMTFHEIAPGTDVTVLASSLGVSAENVFLRVFNPDEVTDGHYTVTL